jgi:hypothetical protein
VKKKRIAGKRARKKLKDTAEARRVREPFISPLIKKMATLNKGKPSNPGNTNFFDNAIAFTTGFIRSIRSL